ncbi:NADH dehydrogenase [ubiquinone] 1 alpha subcomplex subunit 3-like [Saccoglossus kowalevskii]|uniref:NADH dehydrogenase [ubiquinone] 1 alpha subcomplex subunit 3-like n=1 Tax=Saccoglossus kowalevskii TaxID=10224 RepID=A0ABM0GSM5_SACKO|nr:PREDICTED: NADH dehydrogenase [ubiquinone] 1 alpha subcomplex subunit 3-like [Saccoglossus kowalevskii]
MAAPASMRDALRRGWAPFMKYAFDKEPIIVISLALGAIAPVLVFASPFRKSAEARNERFPWDYPVPKRYVEGVTGPPSSI